MERIALWPFDAICFAWDARQVAGFWRALVWVMRQLWRRCGWWLVVEPLYVATEIGIVLLAVAVAIGLMVFGSFVILQLGGQL